MDKEAQIFLLIIDKFEISRFKIIKNAFIYEENVKRLIYK